MNRVKQIVVIVLLALAVFGSQVACDENVREPVRAAGCYN